MKIASLVLAGLLVAPAAASAGGYVSLGIGTSASIGDEFDDAFDGSGKSGRIVLGQRFTWVSIEAGLTMYGVSSGTNNMAEWDAKALSAAGRVHIPLMPKLEGYVRLGLERTYLDRVTTDAAYRGSGWIGSLGVEYGLKLGAVSGSVWLDLTRHDATLTHNNSGNELDANIDMATLGLSVGF